MLIISENKTTYKIFPARYYYLIAGIIFLIFISLYLPCIDGYYYGDDFQFVFKTIPASPFYFFTHVNPSNTLAYRPIQAAIMVSAQKYSEISTIPIHLIGIITHMMLMILVFFVLRKLRFSAQSIILTIIILAVSQANVHAISSNDTISQSMGALFSFAAYAFWAGFLNEFINKRSFHCFLFYLGSLIFFILALFSKETEISSIAGIFIIAFFMKYFIKSGKTGTGKILAASIPFIIFAIFYLFARSSVAQVQATIGNERYQFNFGINIISNIGQYITAAFSPISTVAVFSAIKTKNISALILMGLSIAGYIGIIIYGLITGSKSDKGGFIICLLMMVLAIVNSFPAIALNHVSELYVYNSIPFIAILSGFGIAKTVERFSTSHLRYFILIFIAGIFVLNSLSVFDKVIMMRNNGDRAKYLIKSITPYIKSLPENGRLILQQTDEMSVEYSVFAMNGFNVIRYGLNYIKEITGRNDISIEILENNYNSDEISDNLSGSTVLTIERNKIIPVGISDYKKL